MKKYFVKYSTATISERIDYFSNLDIRNEFILMVNQMRSWKVISFGPRG
jgi:hypothetical protein